MDQGQVRQDFRSQRVGFSDPGSGKFIGTCPECSKEDVDEAIKAAAAAFPSYRKTTGRERARMLRKWYQLMVDNSEDIAKLITWENGKPFADAKGEAAYAASFFEWFSEEAPRSDGDTIAASVPGNRIFTIKEPVGVCGLITPWNFPAAMITRKIGPALAAGCTVVAKSPGETPFTSLALAELAHRAGIPKGVVNFVTALDNTAEVGSALTASSTIRKVSFTGSTGVGKLLMKQSSDTLKKLSFELGGNAPFIVFDDADLDVAVNGAIACKFRSSGQTCVCANRIYVQKGIYDQFAAAFAEKVKGFKVGGGYDEGVTHGPLIHDRAISKVDAHVRDAESKGGKVVVGGQKMPDLGSNFFQPTVITGMTMDMQLASEETFGPVAGLFPFETEAEVVEMANKAEVGLAGYFYSKDLQRAYRVAEALEVGMVGINTGLVSDPAAPFGGVKYSGFGREGSKYGISEYQITKMITMGGMEPHPNDPIIFESRCEDARKALMTTASKPLNGLNEEHGHRRQNARRSGGFLLQETAPAQGLKTLYGPHHQLANGNKGKERADAGDGDSSHYLSASRHLRKSSVGNSPLSAVIYSNPNGSDGASSESYNSSQDRSPRLQEPSQTQTVSKALPSNSQQSGSESHSSKDDVPSAIGYDTDPSQIVNLALSLSESRRRHASGGRASPVYVNGNRHRVASDRSGPRLSGDYSSAGGANLRKHLNEQRRISRSSALSASTRSQDSPPPVSARSSSGSDAILRPNPYGPSVPPDAVILPSEATLARAEKARIAFELSYQYRRLLQHLPTLSNPLPNVSSASKIESESEKTVSNELGRAYNPLQYIRNREVRGRQREYLESEVEGWRDLDRVRHWVDQVASEHQNGDTLSDDDADHPSLASVLPSFLPPGIPLNPEEPPSGSSRSMKSERQQSNWAFTLHDLLADAAWLSRDNNVTLIEDRKRRKILPQAKNTMKVTTPRMSVDDTRPSVELSMSPKGQSVQANHRQPEPVTPAEKRRNQNHIRGQSSDTRTSLKHLDNTQQDRKRRWHKTLIRSRSQSSSGSSIDYGDSDRAWGRHHDRDGLDSAALEKQMMSLLAKEIDDDPFSQPSRVEQAQEQSESDERAKNAKQEKDNSYTLQRDVRKSSPEPHARQVPGFISPKSPGGSLEESRGRQPRTSFDDIEFFTPSSPNGFQFGPSIFINRTAPNSRSVSPKKPLASRFRRPLRSRSDSRRSIDETDFAADTRSPTRSNPHRTTGLDVQKVHSRLPKSDSASNLLSPITAELFGKRFRRSNNSSASIRGERASKDPESRFRGLLKGGRIAELVGNEVSRVGDMIWRRDATNPSQTNSPASMKPMVDSDTELDFSTMENSPETDLSRVTTNNDDGGAISRLSTTSNPPKYHYQNLPNFRSSISQASPRSPVTSSPEDHPITRQQVAQKARGRSSKFDRLAPPKIDMRNISPSASPPLSPTQSNDNSRDASSSRSRHRVRSADRRLNDMLGIPGTVRNAVAPTGLTNYSSTSTKPHNNRDSTRRPPLADRQWSISDRSVSNTRGGTGGAVTKRDIYRVRALLLSSGIKANEIDRQANSIDDPPFLPQLRALRERWDGSRPIPRVPRAQEHLLTAKLTVQELESTNQSLRDAAEAFSNDTVEALHRKFADLDERVSATLIPGIRSCADDADALSAELTTGYTLAVKQVNDGVDRILRRRRRRMRWVRRGGYMALEWVVLGIMWAVWMVVVVVRLVRGVFGWGLAVGRWLLWL
ncbi:MAG: hypothetical protein Q9220_001474 [cf. Caloplaca sp. 1 TL-2023]